MNTVERVKYNVYKILEADTTEVDLIAYKKAAITWTNQTLFDLLKTKIQLLNQLGSDTSDVVDNLSNQMEGSDNNDAKKMIINKIMNMDKTELQNLANSLGLTEEKIGKL